MTGPGLVRPQQSTDNAYDGLLSHYVGKNSNERNNTGTGLTPVSDGLGKMLAQVKEKACVTEGNKTVDAGQLRQEIEGGSVSGVV